MTAHVYAPRLKLKNTIFILRFCTGVQTKEGFHYHSRSNGVNSEELLEDDL